MRTAADTVRGHRLLPPADVLGRIPGLYETEPNPLADKMVWIHYFVASADWWIIEMSANQKMALGFVRLNGDDQNAEWGYVTMHKLQTVPSSPTATRSSSTATSTGRQPCSRTYASRDVKRAGPHGTEGPALVTSWRQFGQLLDRVIDLGGLSELVEDGALQFPPADYGA